MFWVPPAVALPGPDPPRLGPQRRLGGVPVGVGGRECYVGEVVVLPLLAEVVVGGRRCVAPAPQLALPQGFACVALRVLLSRLLLLLPQLLQPLELAPPVVFSPHRRQHPDLARRPCTQ